MRAAIRAAIAAIAIVALAFAPAQAQDAGAAAQSEVDGPEIVVGALLLRDDEELPVATASVPALVPVGRRLASEAARFARCAGLPRLAHLRRIVDGFAESHDAASALHTHVLRNGGCWGTAMPYADTPFYGACNPHLVDSTTRICRATYDRGAIYEQVLAEYAPGLRLSRSNTFDHATRDRFRAREDARNAVRTPGARTYFFVAACLVQIRPDHALALLREEPGSEREARLRALLISDGAPCFGVPAERFAVERVSVEPGQFRAFLAEAVYSWAVAVRRTASLLPAQS